MQRHPRGSAIGITVTALSIGAIVVAGAASFLQPRPTPAPTPIPPNQFMLVSAQLGIDPESLAAAGVSADVAGSMITSLKGFCTQNAESLASLDQQIATARQALARVNDSRNAGQALSTDLATVNQQQATLDTALSGRNVLLAQAFESATSTLSAEQKLLLQTIKSNRVWQVPTHFKTVNRSPQEWVQLQHALAPTANPDANGPGTAMGVRAAALADPTVSAALARIEAGRASLDQTFRAAMTTATLPGVSDAP